MNRVVIVVLLAVTSLAACGPQPAATATAPATTAAPAAPASGTIAGTIAETMNAGGYTYARLRTGTTDSWVAANEPTVLTVSRVFLIAPDKGLFAYQFPLGLEPDCALAEGFAIRLTAPAVVNARASMVVERI